ncbi:hypothetical protein ACQP3D_31255, partial [Escherichia coli]
MIQQEMATAAEPDNQLDPKHTQRKGANFCLLCSDFHTDTVQGNNLRKLKIIIIIAIIIIR